MKKLKTAFLIVIISTSVSAAISKTNDQYCQLQPQYYKMSTPWGYYWVPAGQSGVDYYCAYAPSNTCTYTLDEYYDYYQVCQSGKFVPLCY